MAEGGDRDPGKERLRRLLERRGREGGATPPAGGTAGSPGAPGMAGTPAAVTGDEKRAKLEDLRREIGRIAGRRPRASRGISGEGHVAGRGPATWEEPVDPFTVPWPELPGRRIAGPEGEYWAADRAFAAGAFQGRAPLAGALELDGRTASLLALDPAISTFDPRLAAFLDIETTGLSMGTGTIAFLIGLGWFEGEAFFVRQIFVDRLENEPAALAAMMEILEGRPMLVTFNGKAFDVPVLRARLVLSRVDQAIGQGPHLDLLHAARRLYKRRVGDCSLSSLERSVLGFEREGDIPGELIPEIFVQYLRTGRTDRMHDVFHHNLLDVASMAALMGALADLDRGASSGSGAHPDDLVSLARVRIRHGDQDGAAAILGRTSSGECPDHRIESRLELSAMARRRGEAGEELRLLLEILEDDPDLAHVHLRLAKLLEHGMGRLAEALDHARLTPDAEGEEGSARRVARIERKIAKPAGGSASGGGRGRGGPRRGRAR